MEHNKIKEVMAKVFDLDITQIGEDASPDNISNWDSLHHMTLILALEEAFNIELTEDQIVEILNYKLIKAVLKENGITFKE
jgi:acyl carrier protein